jgi:hypothetical protein
LLKSASDSPTVPACFAFQARNTKSAASGRRNAANLNVLRS